MGNMKKAIRMVEESLALDRKAGNLMHLSVSMNSLGLAYQVLGEWDKSEQLYEEALNIAQRLNDFQAITMSYTVLGWFHFAKGEYVEARQYLEKAYEVYEKVGDRYDQMDVSRWAILACIELGENEKAKSLLDNLHKFALETKDRALIAWSDGLSGSLFRAQKRWKESIEQFEKSLQQHEALGARRWYIYLFARMVVCEYARVYLERDQEGDSKKAYNLLNQALEMFQGIGAKKDIELTRSRMLHLETGRKMTLEPEPETVEVPLPEHVTTGYGDLDDLLFGGIPRNYAVILTSPSCDERDQLVKRFLETGAREGEATFYVTIDPGEAKTLAEEFQSNFYLFICNPQADKIITDLPNVFKLKGVENLTDINIALTSTFRKLDSSPKGPRKVCLEIVSDVLLQHHAVQARKWLNALIPEFRSNGFTTLAVIDPGMHSPQEVRAVLGLFEGEINIYEKETAKGLERFLKIKKMYSRKYAKRELPLKEENLQE